MTLEMAGWKGSSYKPCLALFFLICITVIVNGQYKHPKEYVKEALVLGHAAAEHPRSIDAKRFQVQAAARGSPFEPLVAELLDETLGGDLKDVQLEIELDVPNISAQCRKDFTQFTTDMFSQAYAISMLDAAGKLPSGLLQGNLQWMGRFDECSDVKPDHFKTRYCTTRFTSYAKKPVLPIPYASVGICVPHSCNSSDIDSLYYEGVLAIPLMALEYSPATICGEPPEWGAGSIIGLIVFSILGLLVVGGTGIDVFRYVRKIIISTVSSNEDLASNGDLTNGSVGKPLESTETMAHTVNGSINNEHEVDVPDKLNLVSPANKTSSSSSLGMLGWTGKILLCFSAITNGKKILTVQTGGPHSNLAALNGIRVLSMFWVMLGHSHLFILQLVDNVADSADFFKRFSFQAVSNATFSVDSFFVLSGMLVTYFALNELKAKNGRLNWAMFYFHRYWRLTPVYMLVILLFTTLTPHFSSGPLWWTLYTDIEGQALSSSSACQSYWWTNLLYINNLYPEFLGQECLGWSWYLANDMQFYVISPFILYFLYRYSYVGLSAIATLAAACFTSLAVLSYKHDISPGIFQPNFRNSTDPNASDYIYIKPWARINSYLVGMLAGYALYLWSNKKWKMPKWATLIGWSYAIATGFSMVYCLYGTFHGNYQTQPQAVFYQTVSRTLWSSAVAWVCLACATGNGGPVNTLLSWSAFAPLARLTYCAYLLHPIIMYTYYLSRVTPAHYTDYTMIYFFLGHLVLAYSAAYIMSVCAEAPFMALEKLFLPKRGAPPVKEDKSKQSNC